IYSTAKKPQGTHKIPVPLWLLITSAAALCDDEGLAVHPVGIPQHTQSTDLELINSSHGQAAERNLSGFDDCHCRPGTEHAAGALNCVTHVESDNARLILRYHHNVAAVGPAIDRPERRLLQRHRRSLNRFGCRDKT